MDFFYFIRYMLVFQLTFRCLPMQPFIIRRMGNAPKPSQVSTDGIAVLFMFFFYRLVYRFMSDQA